MEARQSLRLMLLFFSVGLLLLFTWVNLPSPLPDTAELLDCNASSPWCTSAKNRFGPRQRQPATDLKDPVPHPRPRPRRHSHIIDTPRHPLDPLTIHELNRVCTLLLSHPLFANRGPYALHSVVLEEPDKPSVLAWWKGNPIPRKASVVARVARDSHLLAVDLDSGHVTAQGAGPLSGYPTMTMEDMTSATLAPLEDPKFNRTVVARGVDLADLACLPISAGWFDRAEESRRLIKVQCYSTKDTANFYMRPIEGLTVLLDLDTKRVVEITDKGRDIPIPSAANTNYRFSQFDQNQQAYRIINPIFIEQPKGPSFTVEDEHFVKWANWELHVKPDSRAGVIISRARVRDPC